ncbi:MAG: hypothetical protein A2X48_23475 [Lentisphaerae bacterium GWF2_49_21]|nr:MAG: hypothetical protein A2X48_23475 [Lentisphaerae bacterium GWF2_49_21]
MFLLRTDPISPGVPLGLRSVGRAFFPPGMSSGLRTIDFVQILWTVQGEGSVLIGKKDYPVGTGCIAVCFPDSPHRLTAGKKAWVYRWFTVDGTYAEALITAFQIPRHPFFAGPCPENRFSTLATYIRNPSPAGEKSASGEAYRFIADIAYRSSRKKRKIGGCQTELPLAEIAAGISCPDLNVHALAERAGQSRCTLHRKFKAELGMSPKKYLDSIRLQKALALLRETNSPISAVARACGFASANYLAKFLMRKKKLTPSQFRNARHI